MVTGLVVAQAAICLWICAAFIKHEYKGLTLLANIVGLPGGRTLQYIHFGSKEEELLLFLYGKTHLLGHGVNVVTKTWFLQRRNKIMWHKLRPSNVLMSSSI